LIEKIIFSVFFLYPHNYHKKPYEKFIFGEITFISVMI